MQPIALQCKHSIWCVDLARVVRSYFTIISADADGLHNAASLQINHIMLYIELDADCDQQGTSVGRL